MRELEQPAPDRVPRLTPLRLTLLTVASLIAPVVEATQELRRGNLDLLVIIAASVVLFGLVVLRMAGLVRQQERSVARERTLSAAGASLVAATGRAEIYRAALKAVRGLFDDGAAARLCLVEDGRLSVVAAEGALELAGGTWPLGAATAAELLAEPAGGVVLVGEMREDLRLGPEHAHAHVLGLTPARRRPRPARRHRRDGDLARAAQRAAERAAGAGHADLPRPRERGADRGGPPPRERGALRLARPARQRPHHGARRRRHRSSTRARRSSASSATPPRT